MESALGGLVWGPDAAEERAGELEHVSVETPHTEMHRPKKKKKKWNRISENCGIITKGVTCTSWESPEERENTEEIFEAMTVVNFPKVPRSRKLRKH